MSHTQFSVIIIDMYEVCVATGAEPHEERGAGAGLQAEPHPPAGTSPHPAGSPAGEAGGT